MTRYSGYTSSIGYQLEEATYTTAGDETAGPDTVPRIEGADMYGSRWMDLIYILDEYQYLVAYPTQDVLYGYEGNDELSAGPGDDVLYGDEGNDFLYGDRGFSYAANGGKAAMWGIGNDRLEGGNGDDTLYGGAGSDVLIGGAGNDTLDGHDYTRASGSTTNIEVAFAADDLDGGADNDKISAFNLDTASGGAGDDAITGVSVDPGEDKGITLLGGAGTDTLNLVTEFTDGVTFNYTDDHLGNIRFFDFERFGKLVLRGDGSDTITASATADDITAGGGQDVTRMGAGNDTLYKEAGTADVHMGDNDDTVRLGSYAVGLVKLGEGTDSLVAEVTAQTYQTIRPGVLEAWGGGGSDTFSLIMPGTYVIRPGDGEDLVWIDPRVTLFDPANVPDDDRKVTIDYSDASDGVTVDFVKGTATGGSGNDRLSLVDDVIGSAFDDRVTGDATANKIDGAGGEDVLSGGDGKDKLDGGAGDDLVKGGAGDDTLAGGDDTDTLSYEGSKAAVTVSLVSGQATGEGTDTISGFENVAGSDFADAITGNAGVNELSGDKGNDRLDGGDGKDILTGGDGKDVMFGGSGEDKLSGGIGDDRIDGGADKDTLLGSDGKDVLTGGAGEDEIDGDGDDDRIDGGADNDKVDGGAGKDALTGGAGDDVLSGGAGDDSLDGGAGDHDIATYETLKTAVVASLLTGIAKSLDGSDTLVGIEVLVGGDGEDTLTGAAGDGDEIYGGDGADRLWGGGGASKLDGGDGIDTVDYSQAKLASDQKTGVIAELNRNNANYGTGSDILANIENLIGTTKSDTLTGNGEKNKLEGGGGDDVIDGGAGDDVLDGGFGRDTVSFLQSAKGVTASLTTGKATGNGTDTLTGFQDLDGSQQNDTLTGSGIDNAIHGNFGDDKIDGAGGNDELYGNAGKDTIEGGAGHDKILGGADNDTITDGSGNNRLSGESGDDTITGGTGSDIMDGGKNNDTLTGNAQSDALLGQAGNDKLYGGEGNDTFEVIQLANLKTGEIVELTFGDLAGDDLMDGGEGIDTVSYREAKSAVDVNLATGKASGGGGNDTLISIETVTGSTFNDVLNGSNAAESFAGFKGDDIISTGGGNDTIFGTAGSDTIDGGAGFDTLVFDTAIRAILKQGDDGLELTDAADGAMPDKITAIEKFVGSAGGDVVAGDKTSDEGITFDGGKGNDKLSGTAGNDTLAGGDGIDQLRGLDGNDKLSGGAGDDRLDGGTGNDRLDGGAGLDTLTGGAGKDSFVFTVAADRANIDTISDFSAADDTILLAASVFTAAGAKGGLAATAFWSGAKAHDASDRIVYDSASGKLWYDDDGTGTHAAVQIALLSKGLTLTESDFLIA